VVGLVDLTLLEVEEVVELEVILQFVILLYQVLFQ